MIELNVSGMTCDRCADHVREALEKLPGVQSVEVSYPQGTASVAVDPETPASALTFAVTRLGYQARLANSGPTSPAGASVSKGRDEDAPHIAVIGSGGAAMAAPPLPITAMCGASSSRPLDTDAPAGEVGPLLASRAW